MHGRCVLMICTGVRLTCEWQTLSLVLRLHARLTVGCNVLASIRCLPRNQVIDRCTAECSSLPCIGAFEGHAAC